MNDYDNSFNFFVGCGAVKCVRVLFALLFGGIFCLTF